MNLVRQKLSLSDYITFAFPVELGKVTPNRIGADQIANALWFEDVCECSTCIESTSDICRLWTEPFSLLLALWFKVEKS